MQRPSPRDGEAGGQIAELRDLAATYSLLARIFASEVDEELLRAIHTSGLAAWLEEAEDPVDPSLLSSEATEVVRRLALEYARLFLGPGPHLSPHESVWRGPDGAPGLHWGEETASVRRFVRALGMTYDSDFPHLPDHVSAELELVGRLAERARESLEAEGLSEEADRCREIRYRFLREHLSAWIGRFAEAVAAKESMGFYGPFARLAEALVTLDLESDDVDTAPRQPALDSARAVAQPEGSGSQSNTPAGRTSA